MDTLQRSAFSFLLFFFHLFELFLLLFCFFCNLTSIFREQPTLHARCTEHRAERDFAEAPPPALFTTRRPASRQRCRGAFLFVAHPPSRCRRVGGDVCCINGVATKTCTLKNDASNTRTSLWLKSATSRSTFFNVIILLLLFFYDYYYCSHYYDKNCYFIGCSYTGTDPYLTLCGDLSFVSRTRQDGGRFLSCRTARDFPPTVKRQLRFLPVRRRVLFSTFLLLILWRFFILSPCPRGKLAICVCAARERLVFILCQVLWYRFVQF